MFDEEKQIKTNVTIYHKLEDGVIVTTILVFMHGNANSGKAYLSSCLLLYAPFIYLYIHGKSLP